VKNNIAMKSMMGSLFVAAALLVPGLASAGAFTGEQVVSAGSSQFPEVAYYNGTVHIVFYKGGEIFYSRGLSDGASFSAPVQLSSTGGKADRPQVTAGPNGVYVGWNSDNNTGAIYIVRSIDNGATFNPITPNPIAGVEGDGLYERITQLFTDSAGRVHLVYYRNGDTAGVSGMIHHRMTCDGANWNTDKAITSQTIDGDVDNEEGRIGEAGGKFWVTFKSSRRGFPQGGWPPYSIEMQSGTLSGCAINWTYPARRVAGGIPLSWATTYRPAVVGDSGGNVHLAWWDNKNGANVVYRRMTGSLLGAATKLSSFTTDNLEPGGLASTPGAAAGGLPAPPGLASNGTTAWAAYQQNKTLSTVVAGYESGPVLFRESADNGTTWGVEKTVVADFGATPRLASSGSKVAVVWSDIRTSNSNIMVNMYDASLSSAFDTNVTNVITTYYNTILGRAPDSGGLSFWTSEAYRVVGLGADVREVFFAMSIQFFNSPEYLNRNTSDTQYITDLYNTFFSRPPDQAGLDFWVPQLQANPPMDRGAMLNNFLFSTEFSNTMTAMFGASSTRPEVNMTIDLYRGILGTLPDSAGFAFWLDQIRKAQCQGAGPLTAQISTLSQAFIQSAQYANRDAARPAGLRNAMYVGDLYNAFLRRGGDLAGYQFWVGQLNSGAQTRDSLRSQFVASSEFQNRVSAVIAAGCAPGYP
jgi:hypothetical protein